MADGGTYRRRSGCNGRAPIVGVIEDEPAHLKLNLFGDQLTPDGITPNPFLGPGRNGERRLLPAARFDHEGALHDRLSRLLVDGKRKKVDERKVDADERRLRRYHDCLVGDSRPEEDKTPGFDPLLPTIEEVGHRPIEKQIDLDMIVPVRCTHGIGRVAFDQEAPRRSGPLGALAEMIVPHASNASIREYSLQ